MTSPRTERGAQKKAATASALAPNTEGRQQEHVHPRCASPSTLPLANRRRGVASKRTLGTCAHHILAAWSPRPSTSRAFTSPNHEDAEKDGEGLKPPQKGLERVIMAWAIIALALETW